MTHHTDTKTAEQDFGGYARPQTIDMLEYRVTVLAFRKWPFREAEVKVLCEMPNCKPKTRWMRVGDSLQYMPYLKLT